MVLVYNEGRKSGKLFIVILLTVFLFSCNKKNNKCSELSLMLPPVIGFEIHKSGQLVDDSSMLSAISIFYKKDNAIKTDISDFSVSNRIKTDTGFTRIISTRSLTLVSGSGVKTFYITYPEKLNHERDTLFVDYRMPTKDNGCHGRFEELKCNHHLLQKDTSLSKAPPLVYILNLN